MTVSGPKGKLQRTLHPGVKVTSENKSAVVTIDETLKGANALHGLHRALIANMVTGVSRGFERVLEIVGVGYRAELSGRAVTFHLGYSHPVIFELPAGIDGKVEKTKITLEQHRQRTPRAGRRPRFAGSESQSLTRGRASSTLKR